MNSKYYWGGGALILAATVVNLGNSLMAPLTNPEALRAHIQAMSEQFVPRDCDHVKNLDRAAAYIKEKFHVTGADVSEQTFQVKEWNQANHLVVKGLYRNVIARYGPSTKERMVIGAHYDAAGPYPGADDNASGVAGLLELGRLLGAAPPPLRTELVAYTLEEPPYFGTDNMGSARHAAGLAKEGAKVRAMVSLEMIGYFSDAPHSQNFPMLLMRLFYSTTGNYITVVGRIGQGTLARRIASSMRLSPQLPVRTVVAPSWVPGIDFSDHGNYWAHKFPAVMITDTAFYRNHAYHTAGDTLDRLDFDRMAWVVDGVYQAVLNLSKD